MRNIKIQIGAILAFLAVIFVALPLIVSFGSGQRSYHSQLSDIDIQIPRFSFSAKELQDEGNYTIEFKMLGSEEHIIDELRTIENKNDENNLYLIDQWAVNDSAQIVKNVIITYIRK